MDLIGRYEISKILIETSFSVVYLARDPDLDRWVAVKLFRPKNKSGKDKAYSRNVWRDRFLREGKALARIDHPRIVPVLDFGKVRGRPYFVMPFVKANLIYELGQDLEDDETEEELAESDRPRKLHPERAAFILQQTLEGLAHMHGHGMVHRDVKPGNILLTAKEGGSVKLCDFGMVKWGTFKASKSGVWIGSLDYIAPEQRRSARDVDARADVYSAGAVAYRMLTGRLGVGSFKAPAERVKAVSTAFSDLVMAAMSPSRRDRPEDASVFLDRLKQVKAKGVVRGRKPVRVVRLKSQLKSQVGAGG
ncbi:MAG: serine/threonine protein kinase [Magnetovibrionaceae bacterium]